MNKEIEIIQHMNLNYIKSVLVEIGHRNPHGHNDLEIGVILEGSVIIDIEGVETRLVKNDIFVLNHYQVHSFVKTNENNLILALQISTKLYNDFFYALSLIDFEDNLLENNTSTDHIRSLLIEIGYYYFMKPEYFQLKCMALIHELTYTMCKNIPHHIIDDKTRNTTRHNTHRINRILDYIGDHYREPILLSDIAAIEHLSVFYLSRFIKNILGVTFQSHLNNVRFERAYLLLHNTDLTLMDVCLESGFSSTRYLNKMFINKYGCGVRAYMKDNKHLPQPPNALNELFNLERHIENLAAQKLITKYRTQHQ